jgi:RNA polymerase-binding transcription factor DksA
MSENKEDWKPEVGKTAWILETPLGQMHVDKTINLRQGIFEDCDGELKFQYKLGSHCALITGAFQQMLYPTAEAALASIKVYDLEGKEVVLPRVEEKTVPYDMCMNFLKMKDDIYEQFRSRTLEAMQSIHADVKASISKHTSLALKEEVSFKVVISEENRSEPILDHTHLMHHFQGICTECGKTIDPDHGTVEGTEIDHHEVDDETIGKIAKLVYSMDLSYKPDRREGGC